MIDHLDDEAVSAALDGEATEAEQAHLTTCATCGARADALRSAAAAIGAVSPVDAATRDAAIAAALAPRRRRVPRWALGAAAAVLAVAVLVPLVARAQHTSSKSNDAASTALDREAGAPSTTNAAGAAGGAASPNVAAPSSLGVIDATTFADRARAAIAASPGVTVVSSSCAAAVRPRAGAGGTLRFAATATVHGQPADVLVFADGTTMRAFAVAPDSCQDVLPPVTFG